MKQDKCPLCGNGFEDGERITKISAGILKKGRYYHKKLIFYFHASCLKDYTGFEWLR